MAGKAEGFPMFWPFLTTVKFKTKDGGTVRLQYAVSAIDRDHARSELKRRIMKQEVFGYVVEKENAATSLEALALKLPERCVMLLG
jgi:hypothetical protein